MRLDNPSVAEGPHRLHLLLGTWDTEGFVKGRSVGRGRTVFDWLVGGGFVIQRSEVANPEFPSATAIIGYDGDLEEYSMLYCDTRGVARVYQMRLTERLWTIWRDAPGFWQRFVGTFGHRGRTIAGRWEKSSDGFDWEVDFELKYAKAG